MHKCTLYTPSCQTNKKQIKLRIFPLTGPIKFVGIDVMRHLPENEGRNRYVVKLTDRYSNVSNSILSAKTTATKIVYIFMEHPVANFRLPSRVPKDNGLQFTSNFANKICKELSVKTATTTEYHQQAQKRVERSTRPRNQD